MSVPFVDLPALVRPSRDEYLAAFAKLLDTGGFIGGAAVTEFERAFASFTKAKHAISVSTGTDALVLALRAYGIGPGDEVITAANSFYATAEAISLVGATPVLADVHDDTLLIDAADVRRRITPRTKCVIPVHLFGQICDMAAIAKLGLRVLDDAAQAHGATRGTWTAGSISEATAFSFYPTKNLGALGEGGAITTNDDALARQLVQLRDHGQAAKHDHVVVGYNARLDALQCACLTISLARLAERNDARRRLAAAYVERLAGLPVKLVAEAPESRPVYHLFVIRVANRDRVRERLTAAGIATAIHYPTPIHLQRAYASLGQGPGSCPVAERAATEMISLPMYPDLTEAQIDEVVAALRSAHA
jgi:dTDP-4-amino-4,6-dideoxygalactose transaminase